MIRVIVPFSAGTSDTVARLVGQKMSETLGQPLVVCDVYEHAFYVDYQNKKADYVNKFVQFLDWDEIGRRWSALAR